MLDRRRIYIACLQETKWKGSKAREIGDGYKLFYHGDKTSRNGVGIIVSQKWKDNILAVNGVSDRLMSMQFVIKKGRLGVISAYAPQVGCTDQEMELFWEELDEMLQQIPDTAHVIIAGDLNGRIGANREGFERWHGGYGYGQINEENRAISQCAQMFDLAICNTLYNKKDEHLITYRSGNTSSVIDYILVRRDNLVHVRDCNVFPGEIIATPAPSLSDGN